MARILFKEQAVIILQKIETKSSFVKE